MTNDTSVVIQMPLLVLVSLTLLSACSKLGPAEEVRECTGAGRWFEDDRESLAAQVDGCLKKVKLERPPGQVTALISPHAGYVYAGPCTAHGYSLLKEGDFRTVVLLAFSHYVGFRGASIANVKFYSTPLGRIPVDRDVCDKLLQEKLFTGNPMAHRREHSDENQLPFLQRTLKTFKLVPIVFGELEGEDYQTVADALRKHLPPDALLVASSDFTHYGASFDYVPFRQDIKENLRRLDGGAIERIVKLDFDGFQRYLDQTGATICGRRPIAVLLKLLPKDVQGHLLHYYTSGDLGGDYSHSVGYASIAFMRPAASQPSAAPAPQSGTLTEAERRTLLKLARETLGTYVKTRKRPDAGSGAYDLTPRLKQKSGTFVTLTSGGELRGCIGHIEAREPLYQAVMENAVNAAARDPRFSPVREHELKDIHVEISVLSPLAKVKGAEEFQVGKHGILIEKGFASAVFLPQVAPEQGWNREQTLQQLCRKAGLPPDAWKTDTTFYVFTAEVFHEPGTK